MLNRSNSSWFNDLLKEPDSKTLQSDELDDWRFIPRLGAKDIPAELQGCSDESPAAPPAGVPTAGLRSSDQPSGQPDL